MPRSTNPYTSASFSANVCTKRRNTMIVLCMVYMCLSNAIFCYSFSASSFQTNIPNVGQTQPEDSFDLFVKMRSGLGTGNGSSDIVYWTGQGELYESPSGDMLARIEGFEVSKATYLDEDRDHVRIFSRKIFWFRDKDTNEIITEYDGMPVKPIKYDWQVFDLERGNNEKDKHGDPSLVPIIVQVVRSPRVLPPVLAIPRIAGSENQLWFNVPVFLDIELPGGRGSYKAWEFYDYNIDTTFPENRPPSLSWTRNGSNPPFVTKYGGGVMHFQSHRVNTFDELPETIKLLVEKDYSLFRTPPLNIEEVDRLMLEAQKQLD